MVVENLAPEEARGSNPFGCAKFFNATGSLTPPMPAAALYHYSW
ncbi:hypothetical protein NX02_06465 [Sphingomonas sanxanigenens DSM 19645 = NX02]|uniref:Uncharacterized protein n=1 Tax=Sphingomonas sanxanigenens DSM 19645 = NX02 TaxID=1123269 RepID=W0A9P0_9SPHN|nr:hypothetical protein NX02_06465 [Sphingomonas sanxanigenens DSM 19645 = NX02]